MEIEIDADKLQEPMASEDFVVVNKKGLEQVLQMVNTITLGDFAIKVDPSNQKLVIIHESGESGEFNFKLFRDHVAKFFNENF
jgi:hypothetical protein